MREDVDITKEAKADNILPIKFKTDPIDGILSALNV
jgi:hypothetical protein